MSTFHAAGKLMLFGEYLVLQGAKSLSFPLKYGQTLTVSPAQQEITWESYAADGKWFEAVFDADLNLVSTTNEDAARILYKIFNYLRDQNPELNLVNEYRITANFNLQWGLGSSSTFISVIAQWSNTNPYDLLALTFGGSAYDIACATAIKPICYQIGDTIKVREVQLSSAVTDHFLFVYLGQKQNSRDEIKRFQKSSITAEHLETMNELVEHAIDSESIAEFENIINRSEDLLSSILGREKLKDHIFADYKYSVKSLGAWGGDFFLATFRDLNEAKSYYKSKGFSTMFTYEELLK